MLMQQKDAHQQLQPPPRRTFHFALSSSTFLGSSSSCISDASMRRVSVTSRTMSSWITQEEGARCEHVARNTTQHARPAFCWSC